MPTVVVRTPFSISLATARFPSVTFTRRNSPRPGVDNLQEAEDLLRVTEEELNKIYNASQEANETYAEEIADLENDLDDITFDINSVKKTRTRGNRSWFKKTLRKLADDAMIKDLLEAARELSEKAQHASNRIVSDSAHVNVHGVDFSFNKQPTADDKKKIESVIRLFADPDDDHSMEESESVRALRSKRSDLSTFSYHHWGPHAYYTYTGESGPSSDGISGQVLSPSRPSSGMLLGNNAVFQNCIIVNLNANDNCKVSDATTNIGDRVGGLLGHSCTPPVAPPVHGSPSCCDFPDVEKMQTASTSPHGDATDAIQSVSEQQISASSESESRNGIPAVPTMQSRSETRPDETGIQQTLMMGVENIKSHSMIIDGHATVFSPTMNVNSIGATGATITHLGPQPAHCHPPQVSAQSQRSERPGFRCTEVSDPDVYSPAFNDGSEDASDARTS